MDARLVGIIGLLITATTVCGQAVNQLPWSEANGLLSVDDGDGGVARSADDFILPGAAGVNWQVTRVRGVLLIEDHVWGPSSRIEIYDDDGTGLPEEFPTHVFPTDFWTDLGPVAIDPAYRAWEVSAGDGVSPLFIQQAGVRRWVCVVGEHHLPFPSGRFFGAFDEAAPAEGLGARIRVGDSGPWHAVGPCCISPFTDLAFAIEGNQSASTGLCEVDLDRSGERDVADIFVFLSWWFAGLPAAEFDGVAGLGVADVFAFLTLWFAGC